LTRLKYVFGSDAAPFAAQEGLTPAGERAFLLSLNTRYLDLLYKASALPTQVARQGVSGHENRGWADDGKSRKSGGANRNPQRMLHILSLLPMLGDYWALIP